MASSLGEDANDLGAAFDRAVEALQPIGRMMEWMPPLDGIAMCQGDDVHVVTNGEGIHE
jgi:hypothetical protein